MAFQIAPIENTASLPTLDFSRFHSPEARAEFIGDLRNVLHDHGFFYLTGHGVDPRLVEDVLSTSKRFSPCRWRKSSRSRW